MTITYKDSGVNIDGGNSFVRRIAPLVKSTFSDRVITDIGGFGALFSGSFPEMSDPVLVSGTDGVGTKLKIAQMMNRHDTIGIDAVAMCVNDIITSGARPLFFLDYISCGRLNEDTLVDVVKGIAEGCREAGCSLIGGETAEHPNVMPPDDYDIAGFAVGIVDRAKIINGDSIREGDIILGLPSSGIHSNGYSLVRKLFLDIKKFDLNKNIGGLDDTLGAVLLRPTRLYARQVMDCISGGVEIKGIVHITGGGFYENIPRILPDRCAAVIDSSSFTIPEIFRIIEKEGEIDRREMFTTFNMGIGLMMVVNMENADRAAEILKTSGEVPVDIGSITRHKGQKISII